MDKKVIGLLAGHPDDPTYIATTRACAAAIAEAQEKLQFPKRQDRRGEFRTLAIGVSYGGGQKVRDLS